MKWYRTRWVVVCALVFAAASAPAGLVVPKSISGVAGGLDGTISLDGFSVKPTPSETGIEAVLSRDAQPVAGSAEARYHSTPLAEGQAMALGGEFAGSRRTSYLSAASTLALVGGALLMAGAIGRKLSR